MLRKVAKLLAAGAAGAMAVVRWAQAAGGGSRRGLQLALSPAALARGEWWRLAAGPLAFASAGEAFIACLLLYGFRSLERSQGSAGFGGRVACATVVATALQLALAGALEGPGGRGADVLAPGLYGPVFALLATFAFEQPPQSRFTFLGLPVTDKAFAYTLGAQLLVLHGRRSLLSGFCGLTAGLMVRSNFLGLRRARLPAWLVGCLTRALGGTPPPRVRVRRGRMSGQDYQEEAGGAGTGAGGAEGLGGGTGGGGGLRRRQAGWGAGAVSPEDVARLEEMGFDARRASEALRQAGGNLDAAAAILLSS